MSYVQEQQKRLMFEKLQLEATLSNNEIQEIINACQVASGNATGVGKIKGIIKFLDSEHVSIDGQKIQNKFQFAELLKARDQYLDITSDKDFKDVF